MHPAAMELHSMPSEPYNAKLLRLHMARYRRVGDSTVSPSLRMSDIAYIGGLIDASQPYDAKILCPIPGPVCTMAWMIPRSLDYAVPIWPGRWRRRLSPSLPPHYFITLCRLALQRVHCFQFLFFFRSCLHKDELGQCGSSRMTLRYCVPLRQRQCYAANQTQEKQLKWITGYKRDTNFYIVF